MTIGGYDVEVMVPQRRNGRVVIYCHGVGEDQTAPRTNSSQVGIVKALTQAGYILASSYAGGAQWGSPTGQAGYKALHDHLVDTYDPDKVFWWGVSHGGIASLNTILNQDVICDAWYGLEPSASLWNVRTNGFGAGVFAAYDTDATEYDAADHGPGALGYDPCLRAAADYTFPMRMIASPSDTVISKTGNADALYTLASGGSPPELVNLTCTGDHGDASHFRPTDALAFFDRWS